MRRLLEKACLAFSVHSLDRRLGVDLNRLVAVAAGEGEGRIGSSIHHSIHSIHSIHHLVKWIQSGIWNKNTITEQQEICKVGSKALSPALFHPQDLNQPSMANSPVRRWTAEDYPTWGHPRAASVLEMSILPQCECPCLGKDPATKSDEFLEKFQTAFDPPHSFLENYVANFLLWIWLHLCKEA